MEIKTIRQTVSFRASPHEVFEALMDSKKHSQFTGTKAVISRDIDGRFSAYDGSLAGTNIEIVPDRKIVQAWRCEMDEWPKSHYSKATFILEKAKDGTKLTFIQTGVPTECLEMISCGWKDYYWDRMKTMLEKR